MNVKRTICRARVTVIGRLFVSRVDHVNMRTDREVRAALTTYVAKNCGVIPEAVLEAWLRR